MVRESADMGRVVPDCTRDRPRDQDDEPASDSARSAEFAEDADRVLDMFQDILRHGAGEGAGREREVMSVCHNEQPGRFGSLRLHVINVDEDLRCIDNTGRAGAKVEDQSVRHLIHELSEERGCTGSGSTDAVTALCGVHKIADFVRSSA